jgi:putative nucleotidyltransferase with HDIG domain
VSEPVKFLTAVGQTLAVMALYPAGHPSRERAVDASYDLLGQLARSDTPPRFSFLDGDVIYGRQVVRDLAGWEWGARLAGAGIQRIEFLDGVERDEYAGWLSDVLQRINGETPSSAEARQLYPGRIRYGVVELRSGEGADTESADRPAAIPPADASSAPVLDAEAEAIQWMHREVQELGRLPLLEAEAVVRALSLAMHGQSQIRLPLLQLKSFDQYTTTHSSNVAVLAMGLAEYLGLGSREIRHFGVAGLLHDLGKVRIPREILVKPGKLSDEEREVMQQHPVDGARLILQRENRLETAAFVAYEHHIMIDGGGYPRLRYPRDCHYASKLVHVCDVYDALCTDRPYRAAWESGRALSYIAERAGLEFDPEIVQTFSEMIQQSEQSRSPIAPAQPAAAPA